MESGESKASAPSSVEKDNQDRSTGAVTRSDDDYAATGIGRSVRNDVRWIEMELDSRTAGEVAIRYEYYSALVRLGVRPRSNRSESLPRRERATGFEDRRFSPEP